MKEEGHLSINNSGICHRLVLTKERGLIPSLCLLSGTEGSLHCGLGSVGRRCGFNGVMRGLGRGIAVGL
ncbi:hypothetical protein TNCV_1279701 [Trichonephila clavipes]|nr:hypothetical protein TNCV_1279701 [Trichonephila clavipes]